MAAPHSLGHRVKRIGRSKPWDTVYIMDSVNSFTHVRATAINHIYRESKPSGRYSMLIISLVHQGVDMIHYIANNLKRFIKGSFILIVHANGVSVNENDLPPWCWLASDTIETSHPTTSLLHAMSSCMATALRTIEFINCMYVSSGSVFFRDFIVPTEACVYASSHEEVFFSNKRFTYSSPIPVEHLGKCAEYLIKQGGIHYNGWQYKNYFPTGMDNDDDIQNIIKKRSTIRYIKGSHSPGQIFPYIVCKMLTEDLHEYFIKGNTYAYCLEEILPSTYSYWFACKEGIPIRKNVVYYNWLHQYIMTDINFIENLPSICPDTYAVVKVPYELNHPIREYFK